MGKKVMVPSYKGMEGVEYFRVLLSSNSFTYINFVGIIK